MTNRWVVLLVVLLLTGCGCGKSITRRGDIYPVRICPEVAPSPDDRTIVFSGYNNRSASLYAVPVSGGEAVRLTDGFNKGHVDPVFSPDGTRIAFISSPLTIAEAMAGKHFFLFACDTAGEHRVKLMESDRALDNPVFSPDGERVIFLAAGDLGSPLFGYQTGYCRWNIFSVNLNGSDNRKVARLGVEEIQGISVDRNNNRIVFGMPSYGGYSIGAALIDVPDSIDWTGMANPESDLYELTISPDGKTLAFSAVAADCSGIDIYLMEAMSGEPRRVTAMGGHARCPRFFNHQEKLLFVWDTHFPNEDTDYRIYTCNYDGSELTEVKVTFASEPEEGE